jgi:geranylgeranyl pyrophosphate synthase
VLTWFEPEDTTADALAGRAQLGGAGGIAWVPVGLADEGVAAATVRLLRVRALGYSAVATRYFVPSPNTREWQRMEVRFGLRATRLDRLGGEHLVFDLPEWRTVDGPEVLEIWRRDDRWPDPVSASFTRRRSTSFEAMRQSIDAYLVDAAGRVPECHARDLLADVMLALGPAGARLEEIEQYPFVAIGGRSLLDVVQRGIEARLLSLGSLPPDLIAGIRHASLVGGKRIRPILTLVIACALGAPLDAALPAALATEWLHTASLIQDDLPCMDDDDVRRRDVSTHRRHGEAIALLASDTLIALAFQDLAALSAHPAVGAYRTVRLLEASARTIGGEGLVGGQVRDLLTRRLDRVTLQEVLDVHRRKTAPLFRLTATLACVLADVEEPLATRLEEMLSSVGLAFQVVDDVLDATPGNDSFGRPAGSDRRNNLPTFATLMDSRRGRRYARKLMEPHAGVLDGRPDLFGLERLSTYVLERRQ